jgi:hypothetical protein
MEADKELQNFNHYITNNETNSSTNSTKTEENLNLNADESFDQIDLKIEKDDIIDRNDFYANPKKVNKKIKTPVKNINISYSYRKLGNTFAFCYNKDGDPHIIIGPHCNLLFMFRAFFHLSYLCCLLFMLYLFLYLMEYYPLSL